MNARSARHTVTLTLVSGIAFSLLSGAHAGAAGIGGGGGFGGGAGGFGSAAGIGGRSAGFGVAPTVASPVTGVPLAPVGYDGSNVGPSQSSQGAPRPTPRLQSAPEQPRLYNSAGPGPRFDQSVDPYSGTTLSGGGAGLGGIMPPDGSGYLVVEDDQGGATIYGPDGVRRVKNFEPANLRELTKP